MVTYDPTRHVARLDSRPANPWATVVSEEGLELLDTYVGSYRLVLTFAGRGSFRRTRPAPIDRSYRVVSARSAEEWQKSYAAQNGARPNSRFRDRQRRELERRGEGGAGCCDARPAPRVPRNPQRPRLERGDSGSPGPLVYASDARRRLGHSLGAPRRNPGRPVGLAVPLVAVAASRDCARKTPRLAVGAPSGLVAPVEHVPEMVVADWHPRNPLGLSGAVVTNDHKSVLRRSQPCGGWDVANDARARFFGGCLVMVGTVHRAARSRSAPPPTPPSASAAASPAPPTQPRLRRSRCPPGRTRGTPRAPRIPHRSPSPCPPCWRPARGRTGPDPLPRHDARCIHSGRPRSSLRSGSDWSTLRALIIHWTTSGVSSSAMDPTGYGGRSRGGGYPGPCPSPATPTPTPSESRRTGAGGWCTTSGSRPNIALSRLPGPGDGSVPGATDGGESGAVRSHTDGLTGLRRFGMTR